MGLSHTTRRRWIGGLAVLAALAMLVLGETFFKGRLGPLGFMLYWFVCLAFTVTAVAIALLDARALRRRTAEEQEELLQHTLDEIAQNARERLAKRRNPSRN